MYIGILNKVYWNGENRRVDHVNVCFTLTRNIYIYYVKEKKNNVFKIQSRLRARVRPLEQHIYTPNTK